MRLLLDTAALLWITLEDARVSRSAREAFTNPANEIFLSVVSSWEIAVKYALGRLPLPEPPGSFVPRRRELYGLRTLPLDEESALYVGQLPKLHSDPFDRMLICQAMVHGLALVTPDQRIAQYPVRTVW